MSEKEELQSRIVALAGRLNRRKDHTQRPRPIFTSSVETTHDHRHASQRQLHLNHGHNSLVMFERYRPTIDKHQKGTAATFDIHEPRRDLSDFTTSSTPFSKRIRRNQSLHDLSSEVPDDAPDVIAQESRAPREQMRQPCLSQNSEVQIQSRPGKRRKTSVEHSLLIDGIRFQVCEGGRKLRKDPDDRLMPTPKTASVGGVAFLRTKTGNLYRVPAQEMKRIALRRRKEELCTRFTLTGRCSLGPICAFTHDPTKVSICSTFLRCGNCKFGDGCNRSHDPTYERAPACWHHLKGNCSNTHCRYPHVDIDIPDTAPVCRTFACLGFCGRGTICHDRHVFECPDYVNMGRCEKSNCRLPHVDRAGRIKQFRASEDLLQRATTSITEVGANMHQDNILGVHDEDIDSDELDMEVLLQVDNPGKHTESTQDDFIGL